MPDQLTDPPDPADEDLSHLAPAAPQTPYLNESAIVTDYRPAPREAWDADQHRVREEYERAVSRSSAAHRAFHDHTMHDDEPVAAFPCPLDPVELITVVTRKGYVHTLPATRERGTVPGTKAAKLWREMNGAGNTLRGAFDRARRFGVLTADEERDY